MYFVEGPPLVLFYEREYYCLSNFSAFAIRIDGMLFMTAEHAYQAAKFNDEAVRKEIIDALSAHDAKKIAQKHSALRRADWEDDKLMVMEVILRMKVAQHSYVKKMLQKSDTMEIIEDSPKDSFWGWGPDEDGENQLGKLWMKIREELKDGN